MKKKLCLVIPSLQAGGMERVMSELANYFSLKPEIDVNMVMYGRKPELFYSIPSTIKLHQPHFFFNNKYRIWNTIKTFFFLRKKIKDISPDSVLSFGEYWNSFVLLSLLGLKIPVFVSDRCQPDKSLGKTHDFLRRLLYPKSAGVIVQTITAKSIYERRLRKASIIVIGNPIRSINADSSKTRENIVLTVGRLIESKHHDELIRLFARINLPAWKLIIVGGDALKQTNMQRLETLVNDLNLSDRVILTGSRNDVDDFYKRSKIFAFTSSSEGFPNVIGEAMSAELSVVAFSCIAGPSDMIKDGENGYLVSLFDYACFEQRLTELMNNEILRIRFGENSKKAIEVFSVESIGQQFFEVIFNKR